MHLGTGELKTGYVGPGNLQSTGGSLRYTDWNKFLDKECTVNMTQKGGNMLVVEFLINGDWVADFHGIYNGCVLVGYFGFKPEFTWTAY